LLLACLGRGFALLGRQTEATKILERLVEQHKSAYFSPYWIALIYAALGKTDETLEWLEKAFADRCCWRVLCHIDPRLKILIGNSRFDAMVLEGPSVQQRNR